MWYRDLQSYQIPELSQAGPTLLCFRYVLFFVANFRFMYVWVSLPSLHFTFYIRVQTLRVATPKLRTATPHDTLHDKLTMI